MKGICFQGGGVAGIAHIGVLEKLDVDEFTHVVGASAGSIVAVAVACRIPVDKIYDEMFNVDFQSFRDDSYGYVMDFYRLYKEFGWYKGDALERWISGVLQRHTDNADITFSEAFERYGIWLEIPTTDMNYPKTVYMSHETHPDLSLAKAVRRSAGIPFYYKADKHRESTDFESANGTITTRNAEHYYVDGGLLDNYPIQRLYRHMSPDDVVGVKLMTTIELESMQHSHINDQPNPPSNFYEYFERVIVALRNQALKTHINDVDWQRTIRVDTGSVSATEFSLSDDDKRRLITQGHKAADKFLMTHLN